MSQFQTLKSDLTHSRIVDTDSVSIHDDEIAVKIESFAFTANNVTYGVAGDTIGYWKFFPAAQDEKNEWEDRELIEIAKKANFKSTTVSGLAAEILEDGIRQRLR